MYNKYDIKLRVGLLLEHTVLLRELCNCEQRSEPRETYFIYTYKDQTRKKNTTRRAMADKD